MSVASGGRDGEIEAFVVDRYLESLLARRPAPIDGVPADLVATAERLTGALPRYHPSFRFTEELAARLAAAAGRIEAGEAIALPGVHDPLAAASERRALGHPAVIGGVLTSAAISLAGAAWVAWRRGRTPSGPMTRAARAVARARVV